MGQIKNWRKSKKYDGSNPQKMTVWSNTQPQYEDFHNNYYVVVQGQDKDYSVSITKSGRQLIFSNELSGDGFSSYDEAVAFAVEYMRKHP